MRHFFKKNEKYFPNVMDVAGARCKMGVVDKVVSGIRTAFILPIPAPAFISY
jgi:hypothetical protein